MIYYDYERFRNDVPHLARHCPTFAPDTVTAIPRGGLTLAHALCMALTIRNFQSIRAESYDDTAQRDQVLVRGECDLRESRRVLVVDDIVDSGRTLAELLPRLQRAHPEIEFRTAALFTKPHALVQPDYALHEATDWIDFFWERDFLTGPSV